MKWFFTGLAHSEEDRTEGGVSDQENSGDSLWKYEPGCSKNYIDSNTYSPAVDLHPAEAVPFVFIPITTSNVNKLQEEYTLDVPKISSRRPNTKLLLVAPFLQVSFVFTHTQVLLRLVVSPFIVGARTAKVFTLKPVMMVTKLCTAEIPARVSLSCRSTSGPAVTLVKHQHSELYYLDLVTVPPRKTGFIKKTCTIFEAKQTMLVPAVEEER
ncbi:hypothetical protein CBL_10981 [Carabus blaptoides fortunei]